MYVYEVRHVSTRRLIVYFYAPIDHPHRIADAYHVCACLSVPVRCPDGCPSKCQVAERGALSVSSCVSVDAPRSVPSRLAPPAPCPLSFSRDP